MFVSDLKIFHFYVHIWGKGLDFDLEFRVPSVLTALIANFSWVEWRLLGILQNTKNVIMVFSGCICSIYPWMMMD